LPPGPTYQLCRVTRTPPPYLVHQPASVVSTRYHLRQRRLEPFRPHGPTADPPIFLSFSLRRVAHQSRPHPPTPHFSLCSPRALANLEKTSVPHPSSSFPHSPPPTRPPRQLPSPETPSSSPISVRAPPPQPLHGETLHPPLLSPFEATHTSPLPRQQCRAVPPSPPATGAPSPPMNATA
jgi:hypothetical protein